MSNTEPGEPKYFKHESPETLPDHKGPRPEIALSGIELKNMLSQPDLAISTVRDAIRERVAHVVVEIQSTDESGEPTVTLKELALEKLRDTQGITIIEGTTTVIPIQENATYYVERLVHKKLTESAAPKSSLDRRMKAYPKEAEARAAAATRAAEEAHRRKQPPPLKQRKPAEKLRLTLNERNLNGLADLIMNSGHHGGVVAVPYRNSGNNELEVVIQKPRGLSLQDWLDALRNSANTQELEIFIEDLRTSPRGITMQTLMSYGADLAKTLGVDQMYPTSNPGRKRIFIKTSADFTGNQTSHHPSITVNFEGI
jgi:hypothetical protein